MIGKIDVHNVAVCGREFQLVNQNVVDADGQNIFQAEGVVVAPMRGVYRIEHAACQRVVGVRLCHIVEIAADNGGVGCRIFNLGNFSCLPSVRPKRSIQFLARLLDGFVVARAGVAQVFEVDFGQSRGFQMAVEHAHRVAPDFDVGENTHVIFRGVIYFLLFHNRKFRKCGIAPPNARSLIFVPNVAIRVIFLNRERIFSSFSALLCL